MKTTGFLVGLAIAILIGLLAGTVRTVREKRLADSKLIAAVQSLEEASSNAMSIEAEIGDLRRQLTTWQTVAGEVLRSRGYPTAEPRPNDLRRFRLKAIEHFKPVIKGEVLEIEIEGLEIPDPPMKITRESDIKPFWADRLFFSTDIQSITLGKKMLIEKNADVGWDALMQFLTTALHAEDIGNRELPESQP